MRWLTARFVRHGAVFMFLADSNSSKVRAVNLGGWLVVEGWIKPSLFDGIPNRDMLVGLLLAVAAHAWAMLWLVLLSSHVSAWFASGWHAGAAQVSGASEVRVCGRWWRRQCDGGPGCRFLMGDLQGV